MEIVHYELDQAALQYTLGLATEHNPYLVHDFYALLFRMAPRVKPYFRAEVQSEIRPTNHQIRKITDAMVSAVAICNDHEKLRAALGSLGRYHQTQRSIPVWTFPYVKEALLITLAAAVGSPDWNSEVAIQWIWLLDRVADYMVQGFEDTDPQSVGAMPPPAAPSAAATNGWQSTPVPRRAGWRLRSPFGRS